MDPQVALNPTPRQLFYSTLFGASVMKLFSLLGGDK